MSVGPWEILLVVFVVLLLFGATKLPELARSVGRSARIFKSEVKEMKNENGEEQPKQLHEIESATAQETRSAAQDADFWERPENQPRS